MVTGETVQEGKLEVRFAEVLTMKLGFHSERPRVIVSSIDQHSLLSAFLINSIRNHESCGPKAVVFSVHALPCPLRDPTIQPQGTLKLIQSYFVTSSSGPPQPLLWENTLTHLCCIIKCPSLGCPPSGGSDGSTPRCQESHPLSPSTLCCSQNARGFYW